MGFLKISLNLFLVEGIFLCRFVPTVVNFWLLVSHFSWVSDGDTISNYSRYTTILFSFSWGYNFMYAFPCFLGILVFIYLITFLEKYQTYSSAELMPGLACKSYCCFIQYWILCSWFQLLMDNFGENCLVGPIYKTFWKVCLYSFQSGWTAIIWQKDKNLIKNSKHKL